MAMTDTIERAWQQRDLADRVRISTLTRHPALPQCHECRDPATSFSQFIPRGKRESMRAIWDTFAQFDWSCRDILLLLRLTNHSRRSLPIKLGNSCDYCFSSAQIKHAIYPFLYKSSPPRVEVDIEKLDEAAEVRHICTMSSPTREAQRAAHENILNTLFGTDEDQLALIKRLVADVRDIIDKVRYLRDIVKLYDYLANPLFDTSQRDPTTQHKCDIFIINNAYYFSIRQIGEDQGIAYFLTRSHRQAMKKIANPNSGGKPKKSSRHDARAWAGAKGQ